MKNWNKRTNLKVIYKLRLSYNETGLTQVEWQHVQTTWYTLTNEQAETDPESSNTHILSFHCQALLLVNRFFWRVIKMVSLKMEHCINLKFAGVKLNKTSLGTIFAIILMLNYWSFQKICLTTILFFKHPCWFLICTDVHNSHHFWHLHDFHKLWCGTQTHMPVTAILPY